jgi:hypothetical protein
MQEVQANLRKSGAKNKFDLSSIPEHLLRDDYRLPASSFKIQTPEDVVTKTEDLCKHLENVE